MEKSATGMVEPAVNQVISMAIENSVDWSKASVADQKLLFQVASAVRGTLQIDDWEKFWFHCLENNTERHVSEHFKSNFQKGIASKKIVASIYAWIRDNHMGIACNLAPTLFDPSLKSDWNSLLDRRAEYGNFNIHLHKQFGLAARSQNQPITGRRIQLGQEYYFELRTTFKGSLIAFEGYEGKWYPFSLHSDGGHLSVPLIDGQRQLPYNFQTNRPDPLSELEHTGLHSFLVLVAHNEEIEVMCDGLASAHALNTIQLDKIASHCDQIDYNKFEIHRLNVIFTN